MKSHLLLLLTSVLLFGCNLYPQDEYQEQFVIESYLIANHTLPNIYLSTTAPVASVYSFDSFAVEGATVTVDLLSDNQSSSVQQSFNYQMGSKGVYSTISNHLVLPKRTYRLTVSNIPNNNGKIIQGYTTVPDTFTVSSTVPDTVIYQSQNQIEIDVNSSRVDGNQNFFIFTTIALKPLQSNLTPLYADLFDPAEDSILDLEMNSSGIVNESNFEVKPNGTVTLRYPWIGLAFYEDNQIVTNIIDNNIYDFVRSQSVQLGGSTLSPGEIPNVISHLDGAIGIFGSIAADTIQTYIKRPQ